jgi:hypothetical protein
MIMEIDGKPTDDGDLQVVGKVSGTKLSLIRNVRLTGCPVRNFLWNDRQAFHFSEKVWSEICRLVIRLSYAKQSCLVN